MTHGIALSWVLPLALHAAVPLDQAAESLKSFRAQEAVTVLEQARGQGPYTYADHVRLYELLGVAYAYLERRDDAAQAFERVLALDPSHAISYTLSPKATFIFEQVRRKRGDDPPPAVDVSWRRGLRVTDAIPLDIEVVSNPLSFLKRASVFSRPQGSAQWSVRSFALPPRGGTRLEMLPAMSPSPTHDTTLELYLTAYDDQGNEVLRWGTPTHPREVALRYEPPTPFYAHWWVPVIAGALVVGGVSAGVYAATVHPPTTAEVNLSVQR